jgi:xylulokinase
MERPLFLGIDLSTQSATAVAVSPGGGGTLGPFSINFDRAYPAYGTRGGVPPACDPLVARVDPRMWLDALDDLLRLLQKEGLTGRAAGIGVSAQQHGTVYLNPQAERLLSGLEPATSMGAGLAGMFSREECPIWMDASTGRECREMTAALGGEAAVVRLTGSAATERFAGPQIRRFWKEDPQAYARTAHIALISSFVTSLLVGRSAPVDSGDGYGTNLADIRAGGWSRAALDACAPRLRPRLPALAAGDRVIGMVSPYLMRRFGFSSSTQVIVGSGDNPCSLVGLGMIGSPEQHAISLGTSDTYFGYLEAVSEAVRTEGHLFGTADGKLMFLVCFKNGSLAREEIKDDYGLSWDDVSRILIDAPPGNRGRIMVPYVLPEITPAVPEAGVRRFGGLDAADVPGNVRAVAEAQAMALCLHSAWVGRRPQQILVTAGGSENLGLLRVLADVFGVEVRTHKVAASAALGAALRSAHAGLRTRGEGIGWAELFRSAVAPDTGRVIRPTPGASARFHAPGGLLEAYAACERYVRGAGPHPEAALQAFRAAFPEA